MKKWYTPAALTAVLVLCLVLLLAGCGAPAETPEDEGGEVGGSVDELPSLEILLAHDCPADTRDHVHAAAVAFKNYAESASGGKISVEISPAGALGDIENLMEQCMEGYVEVITGHTEGTIAIVYPDIQVLTVPYLFRTVDHALYVLEGPFGQKLFEDMRQVTGTKLIGIWDNGGFRHFSNNVREIRSPEDMKGLKIRVMDSPVYMELISSLGANPIPISWSELYSALETGVAEGQENSVPTMLMGSLHEVQKYLTMNGHVFSVMAMSVNDAWYQGLPAAYQRIIDEAGRQAAHAGARASRVYNEIGLEIAAAQDTKIYYPTAEELEQFKELTQEPVLAFIREDLTNPDWVDEILKAAEDAASELGYVR